MRTSRRVNRSRGLQGHCPDVSFSQLASCALTRGSTLVACTLNRKMSSEGTCQCEKGLGTVAAIQILLVVFEIHIGASDATADVALPQKIQPRTQ
jgi:hypothetical protein